MSEYLKCDVEGCDHMEYVEEIRADMVGRPCPKCGANLLTSEDWAAYSGTFRPIMRIMEDAGLVRKTALGETGVILRTGYHEGELSISLKNISST